MATVNSNTGSGQLSSTITVTIGGYDPAPWYNRTSNTATGSISLSADVPAGGVVTACTLYFTYNGVTSYGGTGKVNNTVYTSGTYSQSLGAVSSAIVNLYYKSNAPDSTKINPTSTVTQTVYWTNVYLVVTYTPATAATLSNVLLASSSSAQYRAASTNVTLSWTAAGGTNNPITSFKVEQSTNSGAYSQIYPTFAGNSCTIASSATAGSNHKYRVTALAAYGNSSTVESPILYTYSSPTAPSTVTLSPTSVYTNGSVSLSWSGASAGVGVSVSTYKIYVGASTYLATDSASPYAFTAPSTPGTYTYKVRSIGNVSGYDSGYSTAKTLTVLAAESSFTVPASVTLGENITATITPVNTAYSHKVTWKINDTYTSTVDIVVNPSSTPSHTYAPPISWSAYKTDGTSFTATCYVKTFNGAAQVGSTVSKTFTCYIPASVKPTVNGTSAAVVDAPTNFAGVFLIGYSKATITANSTAAYGSAIVSYSFSGLGQSGVVSGSGVKTWTTPNVLSPAGATNFKVTAIDGRGRISDEVSVPVTVANYALPTITILTCYRSTSAGVADANGTYYSIKASAAAYTTAPLGSNTIQASSLITQYRKKGDTPWITPASGTLTNNVQSTGLSADAITLADIWEIRVIAKDQVYPTTDVSSLFFEINPIVRAFDFHNDKAGIGRLATTTKTFVIPDDWSTNIVSTRISNSNLLHNWDFRNPVNQRGLADPGTTGYWLDRWVIGSSGVNIYSLTTNGLRFNTPNNTTFRQFLEFPQQYAGKTLTISVDVASANIVAGATMRLWYNGTNTSALFSISNGANGILTATGTIPNITLTDVSVAFYIYAGNDLTISRAKLELGNVSTLACDAPMDYGVELLKCQRYALLVGSYVRGYGITNSTTTVILVYPTPVTMRVAPSINATGGSLMISGGYKTFSTISAINLRGSCIQFDLVSSGLTTNQPLVGHFSSAALFFDANL